ncbi:MAG: RDD family protein [Acidobacteria bacterium]|nr:RDD family protein [Acidobacteriota bacterium]
MFCSKCGSNLADGATFCSRCGAQTGLTPALAPAGGGAPLATPGPASVAPPGYVVSGQAVYVQPVSQVMYAGFWLRVLAYCIDMIVLGVFAVPILIGGAMALGIGGMIASLPRNQDPFENGMPPAFALFILLCVGVGLFGTWLYFALLESSEWQGTAGKRALGLIVTDMAGQRVTFLRATGRHFAKIVTGLIPLFIGYIMAGFTEKRQALHDMIASCLVLRRG